MIKKIVLSIIFFYQRLISPWEGETCRFFPSCSEYAKLSINQCGVLKGGVKGIRRILSCHPFNPGGVDFP